MKSIVLVLCCMFALYYVGAADITQFTVTDSTGIARVNEPITSGVPLPRSLNITSTAGLRLVDGSGTAIPAQFTVTARWGGTPSDATKAIKWLLIDFQIANLAGNQSANFTLQDAGAQPSMPTLTVTNGADSITINTGTANFAVSKTNGRLTCPSTSEPVYFQATGADGTAYTTTGAVTATVSMNGTMRASVKVKGSYQTAGGTELLDYTTWFWFYAGQSYVKVFHSVENNTPSPIDAGGQISCSDIGSAGSVSFRDVSLIVPTTHSGTVNYSLGGDSEYTGTLGADTLMLYQDSSGTVNWNKYITMTDFSGHALSCHPRMQSYVNFRGYKITSGAATSSSGNQAQGWLSTTDESSNVWTVAVRDFWQNFPKAIRMTSANQIQVGLFPDEYGASQSYNYNLRCGEHKTHEILLYPDNASTSVHRTLSSPLFAKASSAWYIGSGAIWRMTYRNAAEWPDYENNIDYQLTTSPDYNETMNWYANIYDCLQKTDFYGFLDYGDVPIDYEGFGVAPMCLKYNMDYGMWTQWMRGADSRYFSLAEAAGRHTADIDIMHTLHSPRHWSDGVSFQHSEHDESGFLNPHRNYGGFATDLISGTPGLLTSYYMTGYEKAYEAAMEIADCVEYRLANDQLIQTTGLYPESNGEGFALAEWIPGFYAPNNRPAGSMLAILVPAYNATADPRYLKAMNGLVAWAEPSTQIYINGPVSGMNEEDHHVNGNMLAYYCKGLGWYAEMLGDFGLPDTYGAKADLVAYQHFLMTYVWVPQPDLGYGARGGYPYRWYFNNRPANQEDIDTSNWMQLSADTNALAYAFSGTESFWTLAQICFREGTRDPWYPGDANTYVDSKGMANAINYGNVFIDQWYQQSSALNVSISPSSISENGGTATGTVTRPGSTAAQLIVNLASSDTSEATVPASVTIPAGTSSATFTVTAVDDALADGNVIVTITASSEGFDNGTATVTVLDNEILTVSLNPATISENGGTSVGTVSVPGNVAADLQVTLASSDTSEATVPELVTISAGSNSANFAVTAVNDDTADGNQTVTITASAVGWTNGTAPLTVTDDDSIDVNVAVGTQFTVDAALVGNDMSGNPFGDANFAKAPKIFVHYFDPIKDPLAARRKNASLKVIFNKAATESANCEWKQKICLYNKKNILKTQTAATYIPNVQEENLVMDFWVSATNSESNRGPFAAGQVTLMPPSIIDVFSDAGCTTTADSANAGTTIYIQGNWFGAKPPKVWIEYQVRKQSIIQVKSKTCKVLKPYNFSASATGLSQMAVQLPASLPKDWDSVYPMVHDIVIDNGIGRASFTFDLNPVP